MSRDAMAGPDMGRAERMKARLGGVLKHRFFLRFHVSLILVFTFCAGLVTTRVLLWCGMETMWLRYLVAMLVAYGAFLLGVRLWLAYVGASGLPDPAMPGLRSREDRRKRDGSGLDLPFDFGGGGGGGGGSSGAINMPFRTGGGGDFAGGGASGSFAPADAGGDLLPQGGAGLSGGSGSGSGSGFSLDFGDGDGVVVLLLALLVLLAVVGSALWIVWIGPEILVEAAFEAMLAGGLVKSLRGSGAGGWLGRVLWKTLLPFSLVAAAAVVFAVIGQASYPDARTFREVVRAAWLGEAVGGDMLSPRDPDPDVAIIDADLRKLGTLGTLVKPADRERAADLLIRKAGQLARLKRGDEMVAAYDQAALLVRSDDPPALQYQAAEAMRLKGYALVELGNPDAGKSAYEAMRERFAASADPELQWRSAWVRLQEGILREEQEPGSGLPVVDEVVKRYGGVAHPQVRSIVADAYYTQGLAGLWVAKKDGGAALSSTLPAVLPKFEAAVRLVPADSGVAAQAFAALAYAQFLLGDRDAARKTLGRVPAHQKDWIRDSVIAMLVENRAVPADQAFRDWSTSQLKAGNG